MVTNSGLWIKDETGNKKLIIKSKFIKDDLIIDNIINEFDSDFKLISEFIQSKKIDIKTNEWIIYDPIITENNSTTKGEAKILFSSNFNYETINNIFQMYLL